jgi:myo-inositol-1(or 4)-monophosphatase
MKRLNAKLAISLVAEPPYTSLCCFSTSSLDWCYTAAGRYDVYLHGGQKMWDCAAGSLVLKEAGGSACSLEYDDFYQGDLWQRVAVAALDGSIFEEWKTWLKTRQ